MINIESWQYLFPLYFCIHHAPQAHSILNTLFVFSSVILKTSSTGIPFRYAIFSATRRLNQTRIASLCPPFSRGIIRSFWFNKRAVSLKKQVFYWSCNHHLFQLFPILGLHKQRSADTQTQPKLFRVYPGYIRSTTKAMTNTAMQFFLVFAKNLNSIFISLPNMQNQRKAQFICQIDLPLKPDLLL